MLEFLEIIVAMLAVFGGYTVLDMIRVRLLYPKRVRLLLRAAVFYGTQEDAARAAEYAEYLRREQKISRGRLIILANGDIIEDNGEVSRLGEIYNIKCKENEDDREFPHERKEA